MVNLLQLQLSYVGFNFNDNLCVHYYVYNEALSPMFILIFVFNETIIATDFFSTFSAVSDKALINGNKKRI